LTQFSSLKQGEVWFALALDENKKLIACSFSEESRAKAEAAVLRTADSHGAFRQKCESLERFLLRELFELYTGRGRINPNSLDLSHLSPFRRRVYRLLCQVPRGRATTYGTIAKKLGSLRYARAVGTAVGSNPMPLAIPCHRVVPSTLKVGNYGLPGRKPWEGTPVKRHLLEREGVRFNGSKLSKESLWSP
jgi:O-6-methylguanine DNA methyltransferase